MSRHPDSCQSCVCTCLAPARLLCASNVQLPTLHSTALLALRCMSTTSYCPLDRSVYITKQVSFRNRVLILFDWMKAQVFGRDLSNF